MRGPSNALEGRRGWGGAVGSAPASRIRGRADGWHRTPATRAIARIVALDRRVLAWGEDARTLVVSFGAALTLNEGPPLPGPAFEAPGVRSARGDVALVGGQDGRQVWWWRAGEPRWSVGQPLRRGRFGAALVAVDPGAWVIGGVGTDGSPERLIEAVTPDGTFAVGELGHPRPEPLAAVVQGQVVVLGPSEHREAPEVWTPGALHGAPGRPPPEARLEAAVGAVGGRVLRVGGRRAGTQDLLTSTHVYDPAADVWRESGHLSTPRARPVLITADDQAVLIGGRGRAGPVAAVERFDGWRWDRQGTLTVGREDHAAVALDDGRMVVAGGRARGDLVPDFLETSER